MTQTAMPIATDIPWPEAYADLLPLIRDEWQVEGEIYIRQELGAGKSGAKVLIVDITCAGFSGLAILKLDRLPDPSADEAPEPERHRQSLESALDFGAKHIPKIVHTTAHEGRIAVLSTVVARGLEYALPWFACGYRDGLSALHSLARGLLDDWNADYALAPGMHMPQELLSAWLGERLDPNGRLHGFLKERCGLQPDEPSLSFEGHWYPNPLAFANGAIALPSRLRLRAIEGHVHGDLHGNNVLVRSHGQEEANYFLIDMAHYQDRQYLFFDHAYFELAYLLERREFASAAQWDAMLDHLSLFHHMSHSLGLWQDDVGLMEALHVIRREAMSWVERNEGQRLSFLESQYILARVAVGLNFANKRGMSDQARSRALLYAASNLKDYLKLNSVDWPKHGPALQVFEADAPPIVVHHASDDIPPSPIAPPVEKDRLMDQNLTQLPMPQKPVVAVLPFENLSGGADHGPLVDGITQEIITELSKVDWLAVVSPSSTFALKGQQVSVEEIAQRMGANYVVEGSVRASAERLRVTAHLIDTSNGHHLWADRLERKIEDVFDLQLEIAEAVAANIDWEVKFDVRERARLKRGEVSVWDRFQKAMWHLIKFTDEDTNTAKDLLAKTVELVPGYALAHAGVAFAELRKVTFAETDDPESAKRRALEHAERAVLLDEHNSFSRAILARALSSLGQHDRAVTEAEVAVALNPSSANAYLILGVAMIAAGDPGGAIAPIETAIRLTSTGPYTKVKWLAKAFCLYLLDDLSGAEAAARSALDGRAVGPFGRLILAAVLVRQERIEEARQTAAESLKIRPDVTLTKVGEVLGHLSADSRERFLGDLRQAGLPE
ncbi:MAG: hypothetical protein AAF495_25250 [Pseudomonadota bacterium]